MEIEALFQSIRPRYPEFNNQVAFVTGSSRGIGKGIALRLGREGMKLIIHGIDEQEVEATVAEFQNLGIDAIAITSDFSEDTTIESLFETILAQFGKLDVLVNNAADLRRTAFTNAHNDLLDYQLAVNLRAPYLCSWQAVKIMKERQSGNIINISSVGGLRAHLPGLPYDLTKGGMDALTRAMAIELAKDGIRVNAIAPGAIRNEKTAADDARLNRIPMLHFGTALDIGASVAFLASEDASYITGQILYVDGGITAQLSPPGQPI